MASCAADTSGTCSAVTPSAQRNTATCLIMGPTLLEARVGAAVDRDVGPGEEAGLLGAPDGAGRPQDTGVAPEPHRHARPPPSTVHSVPASFTWSVCTSRLHRRHSPAGRGRTHDHPPPATPTTTKHGI